MSAVSLLHSLRSFLNTLFGVFYNLCYFIIMREFIWHNRQSAIICTRNQCYFILTNFPLIVQLQLNLFLGLTGTEQWNNSSLWLEMNSCLTGIYWLQIWHAALTTCTSIFWVQSHCMVLACKIKYLFKQHFMHISSSEVYIFVLLECWNYVLNILSQCLKVTIG